MDIFDNLILGFSVALSLQNVLYCFIGVFVGTAIGVLPGVGPLVTIAMLLPITFNLPPIPALIMLSGIYYGAQYGGSTTSILMNLPGETASVVTCIDGYQMARQGRAGAGSAPGRHRRDGARRGKRRICCFGGASLTPRASAAWRWA